MARKKIALIGAGTMGGGIAMNFANVGIPVTLIETAQDALDHGDVREERLHGVFFDRGVRIRRRGASLDVARRRGRVARRRGVVLCGRDLR